MESAKKKEGWNDEDTYWAVGGVAVASIGIYMYLQSQKKQDEVISTTDNTNYIDSEETIPALETGNNSSTKATTPTTRQPDAVRYSVGQEMMAIGSSGSQTYVTRKAANGTYINDGVKGKVIPRGDKIGKIIWVGQLSDGTFRYVLENGLLLKDIYWIADYRLMTPIDGTTGIATNGISSSLNTTLVLKKGSKGLEVKELQKRLGVTVDGDFGTNTLTALQKQKGVSQITLANFATTKLATINFNLMLKQGSKGLEVKELQKRLGFTGSNVDGNFGTKTESALFAMKAVKQTTLNQFSYV